MESLEVKVVRIEESMANLKEDFAEIKVENKEFHKVQAESVDRIYIEFQKFGGIMATLAALQVQVNEVTALANKIEKWRIAFAAKWGIFIGLVGFGGGILTQLIIWFLTK